ncbi:phosphatidylethanolamine--Kdo2-lipid A phosphoethanolamine transferase [Rhodobacter veldkampii DSM 11550]|uniref:Phosphatidylethanolamine--Kdo2-lipid A phosphoethanolamine transferase n=1 Tax=Phaeovulum veldkampii DSM 11550 TaxID=1185920 RepID=A0A2T4JG82_9RHOB|nr:phosphoethanolamine--lipid A transferase [Phaeovulum veldkampii]MBK5945163.1 phosphatidylethanolamine--Kdo2-lipid A phosphoethanolamine transferase [Phaeovulum veldkampii DSM 11550]PTE16828.1 phosphatidylethanolamine--Kdo2-lipid A phosphoethanolamine transferase [Phaeovulum veldkampii DSM 11550]TDQ54665.1 lipid A ethanolaminephosphotransferase [Phaeovulum veldkampii DSM 11550]
MITPAPSARLPRLPQRPIVSAAALNGLVALFIMVACNDTFWQHGYRLFEGQLGTLAAFGASVWALTLLVITLLGFRWLQKPVLVLLLILSAMTSFYVDTLGVVIDREMIQNAVTTTVTESKHLITPAFLTHVALFGLLPAAMVLWVRVRPQPLARDLLRHAGLAGLAAALCVGLLMTDFKTYSVVLRGNKELMAAYQPGAPLSGALRYLRMIQKSREIVVAPLGRDARPGPLLQAASKPVLTVIVAGETARAQDFGLNGYARDTTPELAARDVIAFTDVTSCGTATAVSLPCMFSQLGRTDYSYERGEARENLLDVLTHAGVHVEWWDNNTGDKHIAARVPSRQMIALNDPAFCHDGECDDGIFLGALQDLAETMTKDTVVVLHQIGSHGPAYHLRYPKTHERFTPACQSAELTSCTDAEIRNAYDNTIAYTDHVLASTIDMLAAQDRVIPALLYVSDHGESLGEGGLYLHGAPWFMAPETQTRVPMVMWLSEAYKSAFGLDVACLSARAGQPASHDNLFHTALGMMDIQTGARRDGLNLFAGCHRTPG